MRPNILLVDDSPEIIQVVSRLLADVGSLRFAMNGREALKQMQLLTPDLVLLDAEMPEMNGFDVCEAMKRVPALADIPIIFVTAHAEQEFELKGLALGASDFISKPISEPLLLARVKTQLRVKRLTDELRSIATVDPLTELQNRRGFDTTIEREWKRSRRGGTACSLLLVEIDHYGRFTTRHGVGSADACLRMVAHTVRDCVYRPSDVVARFGHECIAMVLPQTPRTGAEQIAHRVLDAVESLSIPHDASPITRHVTASVGVAVYDEDSPAWTLPWPHSGAQLGQDCRATHLIQAAETALKAARREGGAQGWTLDIADAATPARAREISAHLRAPVAQRA